MKTLHFFTRRKGIPVSDIRYSNTLLHLPLQRTVMMWCAVFLWSAIIATFASGAVLLLRTLEARLIPDFPAQHALGPLIVLVPVAAMSLVVLWLRRWKPAQPLADLLLTAAGLPLGVESAALRLGAIIPQRYFSEAEKELLRACGFTAAFAGTFGTTIAAVVFTIMFVCARRPLFVITAAFTGKVLHTAISGAMPVIQIEGALPAPDVLGVYILLGLLTGLAAAGIVRGVRGIQLLVNRRPSHLWPVAGAAAVGIIAWLKPDAAGQGFARAELIFAVKHITIALLISMGVYRAIAFIAARGAGLQGSIISPLLVVGAGLGLLTALLLQLCFPTVAIDPPVAALIGAGALLAGVTRGWIAAVILTVEMSGRLNALLPVTLACLAAYALSAFFLKRCEEAPVMIRG